MKNINQQITWLLNEKYKGQMTNLAQEDIERLKAGEPVDYVIGYKNFLGCKIDLCYKPLIPRDETEFWVKKAIDSIMDSGSGVVFRDTLGCSSEQPRSCPRQNFAKANHAILPANAHEKQLPSRCLKFLDVFAGSGCCGIAVLKNVPNSHCDFVDIDENCLKQVRLNLKINGIDKKRYRVIKSDVFSATNYFLPTTSYNLILANPPYVALQRKNKVQKSVLNFEPKNALFTKDRGLYFIKQFLKDARNYLVDNGRIYLEFDPPQKKAIVSLLKRSGGGKFFFHKDQFGKWRYLLCCFVK